MAYFAAVPLAEITRLPAFTVGDTVCLTADDLRRPAKVTWIADREVGIKFGPAESSWLVSVDELALLDRPNA